MPHRIRLQFPCAEVHWRAQYCNLYTFCPQNPSGIRTFPSPTCRAGAGREAAAHVWGRNRTILRNSYNFWQENNAMKRYQGNNYTSGNFFWGVRVLMALCFLHQARGHVPILPPQNVTLMSKDFEMILMWAPGEGSPPDVTYTVRYRSQDHMDKWKKVPHCKNIPRTSCILTCVIRNRFVKVQARVKAVSGQLQLPWVKSQFKDYYSEVELAPPVLILNVKKDSVHVNASFPLPTCVEHLPWKYELNRWEAGSEDKKKYEEKFRKDSVIIDTSALRGNYCLSARSLYESFNLKYSEFSQPVCVLLNHKAGEWKLPLSAVILVCVLPVFLTGAFILCFLKQDAKQRKLPQALDFHHFKAGPAFPPELSEKEFCSDDLKCTEQPVPQRRTNRAAARSNLPSSSSSEEEEKEEEDSGTFIPYHQMTQFPKRHLHCQPFQAAPGQTSLDLGSGDLSVLDLGTLGFPFFPERRGEVDMSGSQAHEEASLSHSSSLGRISLTDVRFPGPSEQGQHEADRDESLEMIPLAPLMEGVCAKPPPKEHLLHKKDPYFTRYYQKSITDLQLQGDGISQLPEDPTIQLLIPLWTLQVAEDEGIASDCDSDNFTEGTSPTSTVLSDTFEPSKTEEKYNQKFKFKGYSHTHYLGRT